MILSTQNSHLLNRFGVEKALDIIKKAGFDAADMSLFCMSRDDDVLNTDAYRTRAAEIRAHADSIGLPFNQAHAPFDFNVKNPNEYEERLFPRTARAIEIAGILGADHIVVHPIHGMPYFGHEEEFFEQNMKFYRDLLPYCKEFGVRVCVENMWESDSKRGCFSDSTCSRPAEFIRYIDTLDSEYIGACLDIGHCAVVGEEPQDFIRALGADRLIALHVHDNNYRGDQHYLPGGGKIDFEAVVKALAEIGYRGDFTLEADVFLRGYALDFKQEAENFMEKVGRYLVGRYEFYKNADKA